MLPHNFNELSAEEKILQLSKFAIENLSKKDIRNLSIQLDSNSCNKFYKISIYNQPIPEDINKQALVMDRNAMDMDSYELLGLLETTQLDIIAQLRGNSVSADIIKKTVIE